MRNWTNKLNIFAKIEKYIGEKNANKLRKVCTSVYIYADEYVLYALSSLRAIIRDVVTKVTRVKLGY